MHGARGAREIRIGCSLARAPKIRRLKTKRGGSVFRGTRMYKTFGTSPLGEGEWPVCLCNGGGLDREGRLTGGYTCQAQIDAIPF